MPKRRTRKEEDKIPVQGCLYRTKKPWKLGRAQKYLLIEEYIEADSIVLVTNVKVAYQEEKRINKKTGNWEKSTTVSYRVVSVLLGEKTFELKVNRNVWPHCFERIRTSN